MRVEGPSGVSVDVAGGLVSVPRRVQQRRTAGWRKPENTVSVARPSRYGNPFRIGHTVAVVDATGVIVDYAEARPVYVRDAGHAVALFGEWVADRLRIVGHPRPFSAADLAALRGRNLMCFCPPGQPCHVDVLLRIANPALRLDLLANVSNMDTAAERHDKEK